eukprot:snap_masked-scaffold_24-processed-gene-0.21-mRNA-1 protein AED:1.00 eAED:1.00 QI:0/0/0/0/1/1/2/0/60
MASTHVLESLDLKSRIDSSLEILSFSFSCFSQDFSRNHKNKMEIDYINNPDVLGPLVWLK